MTDAVRIGKLSVVALDVVIGRLVIGGFKKGQGLVVAFAIYFFQPDVKWLVSRSLQFMPESTLCARETQGERGKGSYRRVVGVELNRLHLPTSLPLNHCPNPGFETA